MNNKNYEFLDIEWDMEEVVNMHDDIFICDEEIAAITNLSSGKISRFFKQDFQEVSVLPVEIQEVLCMTPYQEIVDKVVVRPDDIEFMCVGSLSAVGIESDIYRSNDALYAFQRQHAGICSSPWKFNGERIEEWYFPPVGYESFTTKYSNNVAVYDGNIVLGSGQISSIIYAAREANLGNEAILFTIRVANGSLYSFFWHKKLTFVAKVGMVRRAYMTQKGRRFVLENGYLTKKERFMFGCQISPEWQTLSVSMFQRNYDAIIICLDGVEYEVHRFKTIVLLVAGHIGVDSRENQYEVINIDNYVGTCFVSYNEITKQFIVLSSTSRPVMNPARIDNIIRCAMTYESIQNNITLSPMRRNVPNSLNVVMINKGEKIAGMNNRRELPFFCHNGVSMTRNSAVAMQVARSGIMILNAAISYLPDYAKIMYIGNLGYRTTPRVVKSSYFDLGVFRVRNDLKDVSDIMYEGDDCAYLVIDQRVKDYD